MIFIIAYDSLGKTQNYKREEIFKFALPIKGEKMWLKLSKEEKNEIISSTGLDLFDNANFADNIIYECINEFKYVTIHESVN